MQKTAGDLGSIIGSRLSWGVAAVAAVSLWNGAALAQTPAPVPVAQVPGTQPLPAREEPDSRTRIGREAENYDPRGVRLGGFLLFPELEADQIFNDNIYATSAATGKTA